MRRCDGVICTAMAVVAALILGFAASPTALAQQKKKRSRDDGNHPLGTTGAEEERAATKDKDRRNDDPPETSDEAQRRRERTLRGKDHDAIRAVLVELNRLESRDAREMIVAFAESTRDDRLKADALVALGWRGNRPALTFLTGKHGVMSSRSMLEAAACRAVGKVGNPASRPLLLARVTSRHADVLAGALGGLVALDRKSADLPALLVLHSEHEADEVRVEVARAVAKVKQAAEPRRALLAILLRDGAPSVRAAACEAVGAVRDEESVPLLMGIQRDDPDKDVRAAAMAAMIAVDEAIEAD